jgi:hypothetical protein
MKKLTLFLASITFLLYANFSFGQAQPPNGNFETWTNANKAEHWTSSVNIVMEINFMSRHSTAHEGSFATKIETKSLMGNVIPGICTYGTINVNMTTQSAVIEGGKAFTEKPSKFTGWYQYAPAGPDSMIVFCLLTKFNSVAGVRDTIGGAAFITTQTVSAYTKFEEDFEYWITNQAPDTMNIMILSSGHVATAGSYVILDDLKFEYNNVSAENISPIDYYMYPNPSNGVFNISLAKNELTTFTVYNHMGQKVLESSSSELYNVIDLTGLSKGVYLLEISNGKSKQVEKLMLQ